MGRDCTQNISTFPWTQSKILWSRHVSIMLASSIIKPTIIRIPWTRRNVIIRRATFRFIKQRVFMRTSCVYLQLSQLHNLLLLYGCLLLQALTSCFFPNSYIFFHQENCNILATLMIRRLNVVTK